MKTYPIRRLLSALLAAAILAPAAARAIDADHDGLDDDAEDVLLQRFAPVVLLHPSEEARPASAEWLLARSTIETTPERPRVVQASVLGVFAALLMPDLDVKGAHLRFGDGVRGGSRHPADWVAYGHAFRAAGGGVLLQYWFLYAFNDAYWAFDHDGDWEHVTIRLDADGRPVGAWYARHLDGHPGEWFSWASLAHEGDHPVVLAGRGTHASYASVDDAPTWERTCSERDPARAAVAGCTVWRPATTPGGVVNLGERDAPRRDFVSWPGRWGATGGFGREGAGAAPPGPAFQAGWCSGGALRACP